MLLYDNLEDAKAKLVQTIAMYDGRAVYIKDVTPVDGDNADYWVRINVIDQRNTMLIQLSDPKFNYMQFKLGYANCSNGAMYWYRKAQKQYKQGLKNDQLCCKSSSLGVMHDMQFTFNSDICRMLENRYPSVSEVRSLILNAMQYGGPQVFAFHSEFAMSFDNIHKDYIIEYKGTKVGHTPDFVNINFADDYAYIKEALTEALG